MYTTLKKQLLLITTAVGGLITMQAQQPLNNFYKYSQKITIKDTQKVLDQELGQYDSNVYVANSHNGNNQQWIVMPLYAKSAGNGAIEYSRDHIIASKENGKVLDVSGNQNIYCYGAGFHGGENQLFNFNQRSGGYVEITSPSNSQKAFDRTGSSKNKNPFNRPSSHRDNIYYGGLHGGNNQQFKFDNRVSFGYQPTIREKRENTIPPPPELTGFSTELLKETPETFIAETWVPFSLVSNDLPAAVQVHRSPFYRIERSQLYVLPDDPDRDILFVPGQGTIKKITVKTGVKQSSAIEVFKKLNVGFTSNSEISGTIKAISAKVSKTLTAAFEMSEKTTHSIETTYERSEEITTSFTATERIRFVNYILVDRYRIFRMDGTEILKWDVKSNLKIPLTYPVDEMQVMGNNRGSNFRVQRRGGSSSRKHLISWTDKVNVSESTINKITATSNSNWSSGAASVNQIPANEDGWIETTVERTDADFMFGLSYANTNATWNTIDFNLYTSNFRGKSYVVFNRATRVNRFQQFAVDDKIKVERKGSTIFYKVNDEVIYEQACDASRALIADVSLYRSGQLVSNAYCSHPASISSNSYPITWTDKVNVSESTINKITATSNSNWSSGAASVNKIPANEDGWIETTVERADADFMFGLSYTNTNATWNTIDFNLYTSNFRGKSYVVFNRATRVDRFQQFAVGDKIKVERKGSTIFYKVNDVVIYEQACDASRALIADVSLYRAGQLAGNAYCSHAANAQKQLSETANAEEALVAFKPIVSPNPTTGKFKITFSGTATEKEVHIMSLNGTPILKKTNIDGNVITMDISIVPNGVYLVLIHADGMVSTQKVIKK